MKAGVFKSPQNLVIKEVSYPSPQSEEVVVKVRACGVCATDLHTFKGEYFGNSPYPLIPGHEFSGIVAEVGENVDSFKEGDKVTADPLLSCGKCYYCKNNQQNHCKYLKALGVTVPGGFSEYVSVPDKNLYKFNNISFNEAVLTEPLSCVVYGHQMLSIKPGEDVLIFGAGTLGLLHLQLANVYGAARVVVCDIKENKLELAENLGATNTIINKEKNMKKLEEKYPNGFDMVIDATGVSEVVEKAINYVKNKGKMMIFGVCPQNDIINVNPYEIYLREIKIFGVFSFNRTFSKALKLIENKVVNTKRLIFEVFSLDDSLEALKMIKNGEALGKVIIDPTKH